MVDFDLLVAALQRRGHVVEHTIETPRTAGDAELVVDGKLITLDEAREMIADEPLPTQGTGRANA